MTGNDEAAQKIRLNVSHPTSRAESEVELTPEYGAEDNDGDAEGEEEMSDVGDNDVPMVSTCHG